MKIKILAVIIGGVVIPLVALGVIAIHTKLTTATVKGWVKYNHKPLTGGTIVFIPESGRGEISAPISKDGAFLAEGLPLETAKVVILPRPRINRLARFEDAETTPISVHILKGSGIANKDTGGLAYLFEIPD